MLRRLFGRSKRHSLQPNDPAVLLLTGDRPVEPVGQIHYQLELDSICGGRRPDGHQLDVTAVLEPERHNPYDATAVAVLVHGLKVAHLKRRTAGRLHQALLDLKSSAGKPIACRVQISGGWDRGGDDRGPYEIRLFCDIDPLLAPVIAPGLPPRAQRAPEEATRAGRLWVHGALPDGVVHGRHYSRWVEIVNHLKREGRLDEAIQLLRHCADATEDEALAKEWGVAPGYFEQLAICFRKQKDHHAEVAILERFSVLPHAPGVTPPKLLERLAKLRKPQERG